jgi:hypothetical protein
VIPRFFFMFYGVYMFVWLFNFLHYSPPMSLLLCNNLKPSIHPNW